MKLYILPLEPVKLKTQVHWWYNFINVVLADKCEQID